MPPKDPKLEGAVVDFNDDVKQHKKELAKFQENVGKYNRAREKYDQTGDPELRKRLERAKKILQAEHTRLKGQKDDLVKRKGTLTSACNDAHDGGMYAYMMDAGGVTPAEPVASAAMMREVARDIASDVAKEAAKQAAKEAAEQAAKTAAKEAAQTTSKKTAKESTKETTKGHGKSAAKEAGHSHPSM